MAINITKNSGPQPNFNVVQPGAQPNFNVVKPQAQPNFNVVNQPAPSPQATTQPVNPTPQGGTPQAIDTSLFLRPGESIQAYNQRIAEQRNTGVVAPPPLPTRDIRIPPPTPSTTTDELNKPPVTSEDIATILRSNFKTQQEEIAKRTTDVTIASQQSEREKELGQELVDIRDKAKKFEISAEEGALAQFGLGRPLALSTGRAEKVQQQATFQRRALAADEANILSELGLEQEARKISTDAATTLLDFEERAFNRLIQIENTISTQANTLSDNARQTLSTMLTQFEGMTLDGLSTEVQREIAVLAAQAGLPFEFLEAGLKVNKIRQSLEDTQDGVSTSTTTLNGRAVEIRRDKQGNELSRRDLGPAGKPTVQEKQAKFVQFVAQLPAEKLFTKKELKQKAREAGLDPEQEIVTGAIDAYKTQGGFGKTNKAAENRAAFEASQGETTVREELAKP